MSFYKQPTLPDVPEEGGAALPKQIGPYKIESLLTKGGMSLLYLGLHPETKQPLAIKVLSPKFVTHPEAIGHFLNEAKVIALTDHPNIVKLYGQGEWEGGLYISMEFIQGISLKQFIMQQSLSLRRALEIILQVAYALLHLHTHGVIHRDLKPENILITEDGEIKVIDFGIAQLHEEIGMRKGFMGTPDYMSPEQKEDPAKVTFASDIYSLGIITYELVLGKLSFGVINLSLLPPGLRRIVSKTIAVSPQERTQDIVDFITEISQYLKSRLWEKERPGADQLKELLEGLQTAAQSLSPAQLPDWPAFEVGIGKQKSPLQMGLYYDFFKLPDNTALILISDAQEEGVEGSVFAADLHGITRALLAQPKTPFSLSTFASTLNSLVNHPFSLGALHLDPLREQLSFISCGSAGLLHLTAGSRSPRMLTSKNPPLSKLNKEPLLITDNWTLGDSLLLHSFDDSFDADIAAAFTENALLSPSRQAEAILKRLSASPAFSQHKFSKLLISIQRIG